jgi:excisionase family DNA binding protein
MSTWPVAQPEHDPAELSAPNSAGATRLLNTAAVEAAANQNAATSTDAPSRPARETVSVEVAAARLGLSRGKAYELARQNALPVPVLRFGRKMAIPTRALDRVLMATPDDTPGDVLAERVA